MAETTNLLLWSPGDSALEQGLSSLDVHLSVAHDEAGVIAALPYADGLILSAAHISAGLLQRFRRDAARLRWVHLTNAGFDNVVGQPLPDGLVVTYTPGAGATTVAEHGMSLMLALVRGLPEAFAEQRARNWNYALGARLSSLQGRTVMILGFGHVGKALAPLARAFGMRVIAVSKTGRTTELADISCTLDMVDAYIPRADFVVIAAPLTRESEHFFDAERLTLIGSRAFLVNISRGGIVDTIALSARLHAGELAGAAIDVAEPEPLPAEHPIWSAPNLIVTPHTAAAGPSSQDCAHLVALTTENARRFSRREPLLHIVDYSASQAA